MSGSSMAAAGAAGAACYTVDVLTGGPGGGGLATLVGYVQGSLGAMSLTTLFGFNFPRVVMGGFGPYQFIVQADGAPPQDLFSSILVYQDLGPFTIFSSASATFSPGGPLAQWSWSTSATKYWTVGAVNRQIVFRK